MIRILLALALTLLACSAQSASTTFNAGKYTPRSNADLQERPMGILTTGSLVISEHGTTLLIVRPDGTMDKHAADDQIITALINMALETSCQWGSYYDRQQLDCPKTISEWFVKMKRDKNKWNRPHWEKPGVVLP